MKTSYLPVQWCYREQIEEQIAKQTAGKLFYFGEDNVLEELEGTISDMEEIAGEGLYVNLQPEGTVRIDRIVTLFGKPAAAYDEYDAYANACMECMGGYTKEDLNEM